MEALGMRTFLGIAAGLTLASGVALVAASDQQVVKERRVEQAPPSWSEAGTADDLVGQPMVRRLAILPGRGAELGITIKDLDEPQARTTNGVVVDAVAENSAGAKAGIRKGDVVTDFDGERVRSARQLSRLVNETPEGRTVKTTVLREGKRVELSVTPEAPAMARMEPGKDFEFATPPGHGDGMLPPDMQSKRFFFDMHPPADGDFFFKHMDGHGRLGIGIQDLTPQLGEYFGTKDGILVTNVEADTPAAKAGLKAGDVITSINGKPVADPGQLIESVQSASDGAELTIGYLRDHKAGTAKATLAPREQPKVERRGEPI
jgi:membrane-associated protease RseP (regulator of RpoE activity)